MNGLNYDVIKVLGSEEGQVGSEKVGRLGMTAGSIEVNLIPATTDIGKQTQGMWQQERHDSDATV